MCEEGLEHGARGLMFEGLDWLEEGRKNGFNRYGSAFHVDRLA